MTITLEIAPETEGWITKEAKRLGVSVQEYARQALEQTSTVEIDRTRLSPQQRAELFLQWAGSHRRDTPLLTDQEISREALYGGRADL